MALHTRYPEWCAHPVGAGRDGSDQALTHQREQDHIPDRRPIGQHHDQPIDANPLPTRWWQSVFESTDVIFVHAMRFLVTAGSLAKLLLESTSLFDRVVEL